jgi:hypothetical protein
MEVMPVVVMIKIMSEDIRFELKIGEAEFFIWSWKQYFNYLQLSSRKMMRHMRHIFGDNYFIFVSRDVNLSPILWETIELNLVFLDSYIQFTIQFI